MERLGTVGRRVESSTLHYPGDEDGVVRSLLRGDRRGCKMRNTRLTSVRALPPSRGLALKVDVAQIMARAAYQCRFSPMLFGNFTTVNHGCSAPELASPRNRIDDANSYLSREQMPPFWHSLSF